MAVKRRPRLQSNTNILLACLAVTDALTGFATQPSFIAWQAFYLLKKINISLLKELHNFFIRGVSVCSALHLMLVTLERLIAIKFTLHYPYIVTKRNIKIAVVSTWVFTLASEVIRFMIQLFARKMQNVLVSVTLIACVLFIIASYIILYCETLRHQKMMKARQLPQEEVERFAKESKALKTTVFVVGAVMLSFLPMALLLFLIVTKLSKNMNAQVLGVLNPISRTFAMLNSLLNPLIYCLRQKNMRKFIFRLPSQRVHPVH